MSAFPSSVEVLRKRVLPKPLDKVSTSEKTASSRRDLHKFWWSEIKRARKKLDRRDREDEWERYRRIQAYEGEFREWNFISPPINDIVDAILGERPDVMVEVQHRSQERLTSQLNALHANAAERPGHGRTEKAIVSDAAWLGIGWGARKWHVDQLPDTPNVQDAGSTEERRQLTQIAQEELFMSSSLQPLNVQPTDIDWLHIERHRQALYTAANIEHVNALEAHIELHEARMDAAERSESRLTRVRPEDMIYDPDARKWDDILWCAERTVEFLEDVLANPDYRNANRKDDFSSRKEHLDAEPEDESVNDVDIDSDDDQTVEIVEVYRIYDKRGGKVWDDKNYVGPRLLIVSPQQADGLPLNVLPWPYRGNIYRPVCLIEAKDRIEGVSMVRVIEHAHNKLKIFNDARVDAVEKAPKDRGFVWHGLFDDNEWQGFLDGRLDFVKMKSRPSPDDIIPIKPQTINPDLFLAEGALQAYVNRGLRSSEVSQGVEGGAKFATEIEAVVAARGRGVREFQERVGEWMAEMWRVFYRQLHDFSSTELLAVATGGTAIGNNVLQPEEIPLDLVVRVDVDSFAAVNRELNKKQLREFLQFMFVETGGVLLTLMTPEGITDILVKALRLNGFKEPERFVQPLDAQKQLALVQMMQLGGMPQQPGPNGTPPLQQPTTQFAGQQAADASRV